MNRVCLVVRAREPTLILLQTDLESVFCFLDLGAKPVVKGLGAVRFTQNMSNSSTHIDNIARRYLLRRVEHFTKRLHDTTL